MSKAQNGQVDALSHLHTNTLHVKPYVIINFKGLFAAKEHNPELVRPKSSPSSFILRHAIIYI